MMTVERVVLPSRIRRGRMGRRFNRCGRRGANANGSTMPELPQAFSTPGTATLRQAAKRLRAAQFNLRVAQNRPLPEPTSGCIKGARENIRTALNLLATHEEEHDRTVAEFVRMARVVERVRVSAPELIARIDAALAEIDEIEARRVDHLAEPGRNAVDGSG